MFLAPHIVQRRAQMSRFRIRKGSWFEILLSWVLLVAIFIISLSLHNAIRAFSSNFSFSFKEINIVIVVWRPRERKLVVQLALNPTWTP